MIWSEFSWSLLNPFNYLRSDPRNNSVFSYKYTQLILNFSQKRRSPIKMPATSHAQSPDLSMAHWMKRIVENYWKSVWSSGALPEVSFTLSERPWRPDNLPLRRVPDVRLTRTSLLGINVMQRAIQILCAVS